MFYESVWTVWPNRPVLSLTHVNCLVHETQQLQLFKQNSAFSSRAVSFLFLFHASRDCVVCYSSCSNRTYQISVYCTFMACVAFEFIGHSLAC